MKMYFCHTMMIMCYYLKCKYISISTYTKHYYVQEACDNIVMAGQSPTNGISEDSSMYLTTIIVIIN
jgi:hypothetical protein